MSNLFEVFRRLTPAPALQVGAVAGWSNGVATINLPGGGQVQARGDTSLTGNVFVRDGLIEGPAPALTVVLIDI